MGIDEKINAARASRMQDDGGLALVPVESVGIEQFSHYGAALRAKDPIAYAAIQRNLMINFVKSQMVEGHDYGTLPGTEEMMLFKAGSERLATLFNLGVRLEQVTAKEDYDAGFFAYTYKAIVRDRQNFVIAECEGSCNSKEKKYRYRWIAEKFATEEQKQNAVSRKASAKYKGTFDIQVSNPDIYDQVNTILKMAQKRSYVGAVILATNASGFFKNAESMQEVELSGDRPTWDIEGEIVEEPKYLSSERFGELVTLARAMELPDEAFGCWLLSRYPNKTRGEIPEEDFDQLFEVLADAEQIAKIKERYRAA